MDTVTGQNTPTPDLETARTLDAVRLSEYVRECQAAVAAEDLGQPDPLAGIRDLLALEQLTPAPGALPEQIVARPYLPRGAR